MIAFIPQPQRVFVDSAAFYGLSNRKSSDYGRAVKIADLLIEQRRHLFTTNFVVAETHALVLSRLGRDTAARTLEWIDGGFATIVRIEEPDEVRARAIIFSQQDKDYSLAGATSFAVMERLSIGTAFTFDRHFAQFGFTVLGLDEP